jgi:drug/metabolite transporter (DMT)-like permease
MPTPATDGPSLTVVYALLLFSAVLSGLGDIFIFRWAKSAPWWWLAAGIGVWVVGLLLMAYMFRWSTFSFSVAIVLLIVIHLLIDIVWDVSVQGTRLSASEWVGAALAVAAVLLLQFGHGKSE